MFSKLQHLDLSKNLFTVMEVGGIKSYNNSFALDFLVHERDREIESISFYAKL